MELKLASHSKRFIAYFIDMLPISVLVIAFFYFNLGLDEVFERYVELGDDDTNARAEFIKQRNYVQYTSFLVWLIYCTILESSPKQGTLGKQLMKIKVIDEKGHRLELKDAFLRSAGKVISQAVLSIGFIWILFDQKHRGWHDMIAKTYVVDQDYDPSIPKQQDSEATVE
jgi:uncharacterized RDD family membrane protein YckC